MSKRMLKEREESYKVMIGFLWLCNISKDLFKFKIKIRIL